MLSGGWDKDLLARAIRDTESPHGAKLLHHARRDSKLTDAQRSALERIAPQYEALLQNMRNLHWDRALEGLDDAVASLNAYLAVLRAPENDVFVRQADFKTSVLPEFLMICFRGLISLCGANLRVSGQRDIAIEMSFDPRRNNSLVLKRQRVDVSIFRPAELTIDGTAISNFCIPIVAVECKTNFDKNMIAGVEHSVTSLKRTFPECLYLATAEWSDFGVEQQNYANTDIDEIYVLRTQKRGNFRKSKTPNAIQSSVIRMLLEQTHRHLLALAEPKKHLKTRMLSGTLIGELATETEKA